MSLFKKEALRLGIGGLNLFDKSKFAATMIKIFSLYREAFANLHRNAWILSIAMFINRSGSMVLLFTSLYLTKELKFDLHTAGIVMSCYGMGSILGSYTGGWLTDRRNHRDIMLFSLVSCGLILLLMLVTKDILFIAAIIFFYGFTSDMFRPANSAAIADYSTAENRTRSVSLVRLAINLGFSVGPAVGGFVAMYLGYKWLYIIDAFTSFLAAGMLMVYLPKHVAAKNRHLHPILQDNKTSAYRDYRYLMFIVLVAVFGICFFQLFASIPQYFDRICKYNEDTIGLLLGLNGALVVMIEMPLVTVLEKNKKIFRYIIAGTLFIPLALLILWISKGWMAGAIIYTLVITLSEILAMPFMMNFVLSRPPKERQGQYSALYSISYGIANMVAPALGLGIASVFGFDSMFLFFIALSILTAAGFMMLKRHENKLGNH